MIEVPKFNKASEAARWILGRLSKKTWTKKRYAEGEGGNEVSTQSPHAARFCTVGWVYRVDQGFESSLLRQIVSILPPGVEITRWNDMPYRDVEDVKGLFSNVAERLEAIGS